MLHRSKCVGERGREGDQSPGPTPPSRSGNAAQDYEKPSGWNEVLSERHSFFGWPVTYFFLEVVPGSETLEQTA